MQPNRNVFLNQMAEYWSHRDYFDEVFYGVNIELHNRPSLVEYFVGLWSGASVEEKKLLYLLILCGVPIKECLDWGYKYDELTDYELKVEFKYWYIDKDGNFLLNPMSWSEYEEWLAKQKVVDFPNG